MTGLLALFESKTYQGAARHDAPNAQNRRNGRRMTFGVVNLDKTHIRPFLVTCIRESSEEDGRQSG